MGKEEIDAVAEILKSGWLVQGDKVVEFENMVKAKVGSKHAQACSNCTTALHMAVIALGIGKGDKVIVPAYTFVSTPNVVEYERAEVVFADIDLDTFNIDVNAIEDDNVAGIIPVHLFGLCADMVWIMKWAKKYNVGVIEDAACALGSGSPVGNAGNIGNLGCISFHPRKGITTGEGGMVTMNDDKIAANIHALRDFGFGITDIERHRSGSYDLPQVDILGFNYRLTNPQGAIGVEQMKKFDYIIGGRIKRAEIYNQELRNIEWLRLPITPKGYTHTYQSYCVLIGGSGYKQTKNIDEYAEKWRTIKATIMNNLKEKGIAIRGGTHACHMLGYYAKKYNIKPLDYPNTYLADAILMTIPLYAQMTDDEQQYVIDTIKEIKL